MSRFLIQTRFAYPILQIILQFLRRKNSLSQTNKLISKISILVSRTFALKSESNRLSKQYYRNSTFILHTYFNLNDQSLFRILAYSSTPCRYFLFETIRITLPLYTISSSSEMNLTRNTGDISRPGLIQNLKVPEGKRILKVAGEEVGS